MKCLLEEVLASPNESSSPQANPAAVARGEITRSVHKIIFGFGITLLFNKLWDPMWKQRNSDHYKGSFLAAPVYALENIVANFATWRILFPSLDPVLFVRPRPTKLNCRWIISFYIPHDPSFQTQTRISTFITFAVFGNCKSKSYTNWSYLNWNGSMARHIWRETKQFHLNWEEGVGTLPGSQ